MLKAITIGSLLAGAAMCLPLHQLHAQCGPVVDVFPYSEGFENAPAWTAGGNASDWAWGTPNKPMITGAGGGTRSWCAGGLVGSFYSNGQQSWLESPCFDLTSLQYPWISFKLFWETERNYDGLGFQYSLDEGTTWTNLGSYFDTPDCLTENWFNTLNLVGLNQAQPKHGWSGRVGATVGNCGGGGGSAEWVTASHCLSDLAGEPRVKFRFIFGAGTICNGFDGVAVDDILIGEAPANDAGFVFACNGTTVEFQDASALCPTNLNWTFGDPASGAANTASGAGVSHTFSAGGSYTVTLTATGPCNAPSTATRTIFIAEPEFVVEDPTCGQANGSISVQVPDAPPGLMYTWAPGGSGGALLTDLPAGSYALTLSGTDVCGSQSTVVLEDDADPLVATTTVNPVSCAGLADGSVQVSVSGGTAPYTYLWAPEGGDSDVANDLPPGSYTVAISDAAGCTVQPVALVGEPDPVVVLPQDDASICTGEGLILVADAQGGTGPYAFTWSPEGPEVAPMATSTYTVIASDANGCSSGPVSVVVTVVEAIAPIFSVDEPQGCTPHCVTFLADNVPPGAELQWTFGDGAGAVDALAVEHCYTAGGLFDVVLTVTDASGCTGTHIIPDAVTAVQSPVAQFFSSPSVVTIDEPLFSFRDASSNATSWLWTFGDAEGGSSTAPVTLYTYNAVGCYTVELRVANDFGCADSTQAEVCVEDAFVLWVPNAFTPNGDGINDLFGVVTTVGATDLFELMVFDRWGQQLFVAESLDAGWDGTAGGAPVPDGVYAWMVELRDRSGRVQRAKGHVVLLR